MVSNKKRLYIALYPSGIINDEDQRYHWGFIIGPKAENKADIIGMRYHVKNHPISGWMYEPIPMDNVRNTGRLLGRILIAKILDETRLVEIFERAAIVQDDPSWRCRTWVESALVEIAKDSQAVGTSVLDWKKIETKARWYVGEKTAAGRYMTAEAIDQPKPTWDLIEDREIVP